MHTIPHSHICPSHLFSIICGCFTMTVFVQFHFEIMFKPISIMCDGTSIELRPQDDEFCLSFRRTSFVRTILRPASHSYKDIHTKMQVVITKCKYSTREANGEHFRIRISMQSKKLYTKKTDIPKATLNHTDLYIFGHTMKVIIVEF